MHELLKLSLILDIDFLGLLHKEVRLGRWRRLLEELLLWLLGDELQWVLLEHNWEASLGRWSCLPQWLACVEQGLLLRHLKDHVAEEVSASLSRGGT